MLFIYCIRTSCEMFFFFSLNLERVAPVTAYSNQEEYAENETTHDLRITRVLETRI